MSFSVEQVRAEFPILTEKARGKPLVYLDNAATTQKPLAVIEAIDNYYRAVNSNVHRGAHYLSDLATTSFEDARQTVAELLNASREEIIWTRGTTESINLVARCYGAANLKPGDEILITGLEHHANIVPWQMLCEQTGAVLKVAPVLEDGSVDQGTFRSLLGERTRIAAFAHVSNSLGTINPVKTMVAAAREAGAVTVVDGAQAVAHFLLDVQALGCDFYAFSGHKVFGPTGIGVLYGRRELLEAMPPWLGGGEMIEKVTFEKSTWNALPYKFEAGTPHIAGAIGLGTAINWLTAMDRNEVEAHEQDLLAYAMERARATPGMRLIGTAAHKIGVLSFLIDGTHPHDLGHLLDQQGVAVRTGHHCTMPLMDRFGVPGTVRASFSVYNNRDDIDALFAAIEKARTFL